MSGTGPWSVRTREGNPVFLASATSVGLVSSFPRSVLCPGHTVQTTHPRLCGDQVPSFPSGLTLRNVEGKVTAV